MVHSWVGNVLTVSHWNETVLQEGLTGYLQFLILPTLEETQGLGLSQM